MLLGIQVSTSKKMEAFRFGLSIPYIQNRASEMSRKLLDIPRTVLLRPRRYKRRRIVPKKKQYIPKPPVLKIYTPPVFSIELDNMFEILDI
jgi:hypothetical protein